MKYLLILLFTFNAYAEFKVEYIETSTGGTYNFEKQDEQKAKDHLIKIIKKSQWMKGEWKQEVSDIFKVVKYTDAVDTGKTQVVTDIDGNEQTVPVYEYVEKERNSYFHPTNFTYKINDITKDLADKATKKAARKARRQATKDSMDNLHSYTKVKDWRDKINESIRVLTIECMGDN